MVGCFRALSCSASLTSNTAFRFHITPRLDDITTQLDDITTHQRVVISSNMIKSCSNNALVCRTIIQLCRSMIQSCSNKEKRLLASARRVAARFFTSNTAFRFHSVRDWVSLCKVTPVILHGVLSPEFRSFGYRVWSLGR